MANYYTTVADCFRCSADQATWLGNFYDLFSESFFDEETDDDLAFDILIDVEVGDELANEFLNMRKKDNPLIDKDRFDMLFDFDLTVEKDGDSSNSIVTFRTRDESTDIEALGTFLHLFAKRFGKTVALEYSTCCDKYRVGSFSGGVVVGNPKDYRVLTTGEICYLINSTKDIPSVIFLVAKSLCASFTDMLKAVYQLLRSR